MTEGAETAKRFHLRSTSSMNEASFQIPARCKRRGSYSRHRDTRFTDISPRPRAFLLVYLNVSFKDEKLINSSEVQFFAFSLFYVLLMLHLRNFCQTHNY